MIYVLATDSHTTRQTANANRIFLRWANNASFNFISVVKYALDDRQQVVVDGLRAEGRRSWASRWWVWVCLTSVFRESGKCTLHYIRWDRDWELKKGSKTFFLLVLCFLFFCLVEISSHEIQSDVVVVEVNLNDSAEDRFNDFNFVSVSLTCKRFPAHRHTNAIHCRDFRASGKFGECRPDDEWKGVGRLEKICKCKMQKSAFAVRRVTRNLFYCK